MNELLFYKITLKDLRNQRQAQLCSAEETIP